MNFFTKERTRMGEALARFAVATGKAADDDAELVRELDALLRDWKNLAPDVQAALAEAFRHAGIELGRSAGLTDKVELNALNEAAESFAAERAAELVGMKILGDGTLVPNPDARWAITDTTRDDLKRIVQRAFDEGIPPRELSTLIEESTTFSEARADMVARTEMNRAQTQGAHATARQLGAIGKESVLSNDHTLDDECDDNSDDGVIALGDVFSSGDDGPPYHPNCECGLIFYTADDEEAAELVGQEA